MTPAAVAVNAAVAEPRGRFRDLAAAEWIKYRSLRSTPWSLLISALAVLAFNAGAAWNQDRYWHANGVTAARFISDGLPSSRSRACSARWRRRPRSA
jgi:ABC-2 type transport system permease protein